MHQGLRKEVKAKDLVNLNISVLGLMESEESWGNVMNKGVWAKSSKRGDLARPIC